MKLLTQKIYNKLLANGRKRHAVQGTEQEYDPMPVVKLFAPDGSATWLLTEIDPDDPDIAIGLCDLGFGFPEFGPVHLPELMAARGPVGLPIERDRFFDPEGQPLSTYIHKARECGSLTAIA